MVCCQFQFRSSTPFYNLRNKEHNMKLHEVNFGYLNGKEVKLFTLENNSGMTIKVMNYGATITSIIIRDKAGNPTSVSCGFDTLEAYFSEDYLENAPYFGCTVGRYCSQIKDATFKLNDVDYRLAKNCGNNNLHGGLAGFDKKIWDAKQFETNETVGVHFTLQSFDGEEGFPGNVFINLKMELTNENEIRFNYHATTDKTTPLSFTNHSYFNLSGFKNTVETHQVKVYSNKLQEMDNSGAATGKILDVSDTINNLQSVQVIAEIQNALGDGFEHFYVFDNLETKLLKVAEVTEPETNRKLEVFSTEPCMLFYTGKYTSNKLQRNSNEKYGKFRGFCCETHRWQNGPNIPDSPNTFTSPEKPFESTTVLKLTF